MAHDDDSGPSPRDGGADGVAELRTAYRNGTLERDDLDPDPIRQFRHWFDAAVGAGLREANAMTLATADAEGRVSARMVLLKAVDAAGFVFYSNYGSRKARDLHANPAAALVFWWPTLERQVRVEGRVSRLDPEASERYFRSRPHASQLGAWASRQSEELEDRGGLERRMAALQARWEPGQVPLPSFWGGYRLAPARLEFWQGRDNRLHDRFLYERSAAQEPPRGGDDGATPGAWRIVRLSP